MRNHLLHFETGLEKFVERLFGSRMDKRAVLRALVRAFDDELAQQKLYRPTAPTHYTLRFHPDDYAAVMTETPALATQLEDTIIKLARQHMAILLEHPTVTLKPDHAQSHYTISIRMSHNRHERPSTNRMAKVTTNTLPDADIPSAQLLLDGAVLRDLDRYVVNVGRNIENHIALVDDPRLSRYHCQLRLKQGRYVIYDLNSTHGTFVNDARISEQVLQSGDVITVGSARLVYVEEEATDEHARFDTAIKPPTGFRKAG